MKVAVHVAGAAMRGNELQLLRVTAGLAGRGHEVAVSCRPGPVEEAFRTAGLRTTPVRPRGDADLYHAIRFAAWLRSEGPDAVLLTSWKRVFIGGWCARLGGVPRTVLRLGAVQEIRPFRGALERHALEQWYDAVVANSQRVREQVVRAAPRVRAVYVVPNAVTASGAAPAPLRAELGIGPAPQLAVVVGGWEARKGFSDLLAAVPMMPQNLHLALVGGGDPARGEALLQQARALGVARRLHLLGHRTDVPALLAAADLVVLPSRSEGLSVALLEAMAARKPIVATDVGGVQDALGAVEGRLAGWIVPARDAEALAGAVRSVAGAVDVGSADIADRTAEAGRRVEQWFTDDRMLDGYEAALRGDA